jgi:hypothetical protein
VKNDAGSLVKKMKIEKKSYQRGFHSLFDRGILLISPLEGVGRFFNRALFERRGH